MNEVEHRLVAFEERITELEQAMDQLTTHVISLESIMTSIADVVAPDALDSESEEEK